jgi:hypothetical protein
VSYEEFWQAGEEKDVATLELQQAAETTRAAPRWRRSRLKIGCLSCFLLADTIRQDPLLT